MSFAIFDTENSKHTIAYTWSQPNKKIKKATKKKKGKIIEELNHDTFYAKGKTNFLAQHALQCLSPQIQLVKFIFFNGIWIGCAG